MRSIMTDCASNATFWIPLAALLLLLLLSEVIGMLPERVVASSSVLQLLSHVVKRVITRLGAGSGALLPRTADSQPEPDPGGRPATTVA